MMLSPYILFFEACNAETHARVGGEVTPDNFLIDKVIFEVVNRTISPKHIEYAVDVINGCTVKREVEAEHQTQPSLTDEFLIAVAKMAKRAEKFHKAPQDVEWAIDADLPAPDNGVVLQSRPETVWSQKKRQSVTASSAKGIAGVKIGHVMTKGETKNRELGKKNVCCCFRAVAELMYALRS